MFKKKIEKLSEKIEKLSVEKKLDSDSHKQLSHIACPGPLVSRLS